MPTRSSPLRTYGERVQMDFPLVRSGESFVLDGSRQSADAVRERDETNRLNPDGVFLATTHFEYEVKTRISWRTELGTPDTQVF